VALILVSLSFTRSSQILHEPYGSFLSGDSGKTLTDELGLLDLIQQSERVIFQRNEALALIVCQELISGEAILSSTSAQCDVFGGVPFILSYLQLYRDNETLDSK
jgi:hypothetical protein